MTSARPTREPDSAPEPVFIEFGRYEIDHDGFGGFQPVRCVRDKRYKLVINLLTTDELYDMEKDPGEMKNLIRSGTHESIRNALHDTLRPVAVGLGAMGLNIVLSLILGRPADAGGMAHALFSRLREADALGADTLFSEAVSTDGVGLAVMNRLGRAAAFHIIEA